MKRIILLIRNIKKRANKRPILWSILLILAVVIMAYGLTAFMYYGQDDHSLIFKLQRLEEGVGQYGVGITGRKSSSPYRYMVVPFVPIYMLFGTRPFAYFAVGIFNYFLASIAVYFLAWVLTRNKKIALISGLIFASGFFGSDTMLRLTNSYQTPHTILFMCITLALYKLYTDKKSFLLYLLSFIFFALTIEGFWIRSPGMIFLVLGLEVLFNLNLLKSPFRLIPFFFIYYQQYIKGSPSAPEVTNYLKTLFLGGGYQMLLVPIRSLFNLFIPDKFVPEQNILIPLLFVISLIAVLIKKKSRVMWYAIGFTLASFMVYIAHDPTRIITTTHRYSTIPFVGIALFLGVFLEKIFNNERKYVLASVALILFNVVQMNVYSVKNLKERNIPTRRFYETLKKQVPTLPKGSALLFDVKDDSESRRLFSEFFGVGSMPEMTAIAWQYEIDRYDLYLPENFVELLSLVKNGKVEKDKIFTFYYDAGQGLVNTTGVTRRALFGGVREELFFTGLSDLNVDFSSPLELKLKITTRLNEERMGSQERKILDYENYLNYLDSRSSYYRSVSASASSEWKYQEVRNIVDQEVDTTWMSDRFEWHDISAAEVILDLGWERDIGAAKMVYTSPDRVPMKFSYRCSINGSLWTDLEGYSEVPSVESGFIASRFLPSTCRFVKLLIEKTKIDDSPQIAELEILDSRFKNIDFIKADEIRKNPYSFVSNYQQKTALRRYLARNKVDSEVCIYTNKYNPKLPKCQMLKLEPDSTRMYSVVAPPGGTLLEYVELVTTPEVEVTVELLSVSTPSYDELERRGYILDYPQTY